MAEKSEDPLRENTSLTVKMRKFKLIIENVEMHDIFSQKAFFLLFLSPPSCFRAGRGSNDEKEG